jgi:carboxyl-terminal processing protease
MHVRHPLACLLLLLLALAAPAQPITPEQREDVLAGVTRVVTERAYVPGVDLSLWPEKLASFRDQIDRATDHADFVRAVNRALRRFGISHIRLRTPQAREARVTNTTIGIGVQTRPDTESLLITDVAPDSPAENAGLQPGDRIIAVDGQPTDAAADLQGPEGSPITLRIVSPSGDSREVSLLRQRISNRRPESLTWIDDNTAVLRIWTFSTAYDRDHVENLLADAQRASNLILDLRSNGGGQLRNLLHLLNHLLPPDTVVGTPITRAVALRTRTDEQGNESPDLEAMAESASRRLITRSPPRVPPFPGRIAVLVNRGSASCSEIAAAALRESLDAPIIGTPTAGAVLFSSFARLPHGFEIQYPGADFLTAKGRRLEGNPLRPDVYAPTPRRGEPDQALARALELLKAATADDDPAPAGPDRLEPAAHTRPR